MRIEINWNITRCNEIEQTSGEETKEKKIKIKSNRWKSYNDTSAHGCVRICGDEETTTKMMMIIQSQPRKSYKIELHAMVLRINMYTCQNLIDWMHKLCRFYVLVFLSASVHRFWCAPCMQTVYSIGIVFFVGVPAASK